MEPDIFEFFMCVFAYALMLVALFGCVVPFLPGPALAAFAVLLAKLGGCPIGWLDVAVVAGVMCVIQALDFACSWAGAKTFGATWRGGVGAVLGVFVGAFTPPVIVWIFLMPFVLAFLFELSGGGEVGQSLKAGFGAFLGNAVSAVLKLAFVVGVIAFVSMRLLGRA